MPCTPGVATPPPDCHRFMESQILPLKDRGLKLCSHVVKFAERDYADILDPNVERSSDLIRMWSYFKKIHTPNEIWCEVEEAVEILKLYEHGKPSQISHSICPEYYKVFKSTLNDIR